MTHDDKIVVFGMSCVGKTTFARSIESHDYICFDAFFDWYSIETLGLSISVSLAGIAEMVKGKYVLDGWHLGDKEGKFLPRDATVYVLYAEYERIIGQYRIEVGHPDDYRPMFRRWYYEVPYERFSKVRYFENTGEFIERTSKDFQIFIERNR